MQHHDDALRIRQTPQGCHQVQVQVDIGLARILLPHVVQIHHSLVLAERVRSRMNEDAVSPGGHSVPVLEAIPFLQRLDDRVRDNVERLRLIAHVRVRDAVEPLSVLPQVLF